MSLNISNFIYNKLVKFWIRLFAVLTELEISNSCLHLVLLEVTYLVVGLVQDIFMLLVLSLKSVTDEKNLST